MQRIGVPIYARCDHHSIQILIVGWWTETHCRVCWANYWRSYRSSSRSFFSRFKLMFSSSVSGFSSLFWVFVSELSASLLNSHSIALEKVVPVLVSLSCSLFLGCYSRPRNLNYLLIDWRINWSWLLLVWSRWTEIW